MEQIKSATTGVVANCAMAKQVNLCARDPMTAGSLCHVTCGLPGLQRVEGDSVRCASGDVHAPTRARDDRRDRPRGVCRTLKKDLKLKSKTHHV